jgi:uncharacterized protein with HEPN domain
MGEAVRHVPEAVKAATPDIPWTTMAAVRNRIIHAHFGIDDTILFTTIEAELKPQFAVARSIDPHARPTIAAVRLIDRRLRTCPAELR